MQSFRELFLDSRIKEQIENRVKDLAKIVRKGTMSLEAL
jgi:hypothetical protein